MREKVGETSEGSCSDVKQVKSGRQKCEVEEERRC